MKRELPEEFKEFFQNCFATLLPNKELYFAPYLNVIIDRLIGLYTGKINRLIINIPPRFMKSLICSVAYPAWLLGLEPQKSVIVASYSAGLALKHSIDTRFILNSAWYRATFPSTVLNKEQNTKSKFQTTLRGFRLATSIDGTLTGEGADLLITDDPINAVQANSQTYRSKVQSWFQQTFMTRLNHRKLSSVIIVMHRLHQSDLCEHLIKNHSNWHVLSLPMINEDAQNFYSINTGKLLWKRRCNSILNEKFYVAQDILEIKNEIGSLAFAAQYQQQPTKIIGNLVKREWLNNYQKINDYEIEYITQSWDTAIGEGQNNDYSVCITFAKIYNSFYVIDIFREKLNYPALKRQIMLQFEKWKANVILIENKSSGQTLIQDLKANTSLPIIPIEATISKLDRLYKVIALIEAGRLYVPENSCWLHKFEEELLSFPEGKNDDQVDSLTQYLNYETAKSRAKIGIRYL